MKKISIFTLALLTTVLLTGCGEKTIESTKNETAHKVEEVKTVAYKKVDDVKEVAKSYGGGVQIENYNDLKEGDIIEVFVMEQVKR